MAWRSPRDRPRYQRVFMKKYVEKARLCETAHHRSFLIKYSQYARYYNACGLWDSIYVAWLSNWFHFNSITTFSPRFYFVSSRMRCNLLLAGVVTGLISSTCASILTKVGTIRESSISIDRRDTLAYTAHTIDQPVRWSFKLLFVCKFWLWCVDWSFSKWSSVCSTYKCYLQTKVLVRCEVL